MSDNSEPSAAPISLDLTDPMIFPLVPLARRDAVKTLWALNNRLGEMAASGKEPALRQIRLRWWADQLALTENGTVPPEPLLAETAAALTPLLGSPALVELAEAWLDAAVPDEDGRMATGQGGQLFAMTARLLDTPASDEPALDRAGRLWAEVVALSHHDDPPAQAWDAAAQQAATIPVGSLPRPLAALTALTRAVALRRGERRWRREQLLILRVGLFGR